GRRRKRERIRACTHTFLPARITNTPRPPLLLPRHPSPWLREAVALACCASTRSLPVIARMRPRGIPEGNQGTRSKASCNESVGRMRVYRTSERKPCLLLSLCGSREGAAAHLAPS